MIDRKEYFQMQIDRSRSKFSYCKVSIKDTLQYVNILRECFNGTGNIGPVICMGTRNGREVDLFRIALRSCPLWHKLISLSEQQKLTRSLLGRLAEGFPARSDYRNINDKSVIGVEINPQAKRDDIFIGSFDSLPEEWTGRFGVLFSNSFDHSIDPERTAREWKKVVRPEGILILLWTEADASETDLVGNITEQYLNDVFQMPKINLEIPKSIYGYNQTFLLKKDKEC